MRLIKSKEVIKLKHQGFSFAKIGCILGIHKGTAYRLYKKGLANPNYFERVGNKALRTSRPFLTERFSGKWSLILYVVLPRYLKKRLGNSIKFMTLYDYFLDFAYTTPFPNARNPYAYFWGHVRKVLNGVFTLYGKVYQNKKEIPREDFIEVAGAEDRLKFIASD
ncbi:MAG TPA: hypothetical protein ENG63_00905 [Candidatus Desulfofervidus auxilii]|uniref:Helix-turn-helix domain-containing protein n=1 Tax=Desulfofervidus auxilii TaxID=1621989 RepID=A0A7C0Y4E6_DESA2|nr:hypothetical protein [Candidatus Desulfofervidus auxilii]